jgi:hypothetical protein
MYLHLELYFWALVKVVSEAGMPIIHVYMWSGVSKEAKQKIVKGLFRS